MAIVKKNDNFYGHTQDTYVKISGFLKKETGKDENGKLYSLEVQIDFYTNESKEFHFSQTSKVFKDLRDSECNFEYAYEKLKLEPEFVGYIDLI